MTMQYAFIGYVVSSTFFHKTFRDSAKNYSALKFVKSSLQHTVHIPLYRVDHKVGQVGANKKTFLIIAEI
jgi:hypothetical protein